MVSSHMGKAPWKCSSRIADIGDGTDAKRSTTMSISASGIPVVKLEISAFSHPFWTGTMRELDSDGKIDRFRRRYQRK